MAKKIRDALEQDRKQRISQEVTQAKQQGQARGYARRLLRNGYSHERVLAEVGSKYGEEGRRQAINVVQNRRS